MFTLFPRRVPEPQAQSRGLRCAAYELECSDDMAQDPGQFAEPTGGAASGATGRRGTTAVEYAFMLSLVILAVTLAVQHVGEWLGESATSVTVALEANEDESPPDEADKDGDD